MPVTPIKPGVAGKTNTTSKMTAQQLRELLQSDPDLKAELRSLDAEEVTALSNELDAKFAECKDLLAKIEALDPDFTAPWNKAPQQCALDIQKFLKEHGGAVTKTEIVAALEEKHSSGKVEKTLVNRCAGERPLWTYAEATETYTLLKNKKNSNNN